MISRTLRYTFEFISLVVMSTAFRYAVGATATALVTVTILAPRSDIGGLAVSTHELDMLGKTSEEISIINTTQSWREIEIDLVPQFGSVAACNIHYSPMSTSIPPGGMQVIRLLNRTDSQQPCLIDHRLKITDPRHPDVPLFDVPVRTATS